MIKILLHLHLATNGNKENDAHHFKASCMFSFVRHKYYTAVSFAFLCVLIISAFNFVYNNQKYPHTQKSTRKKFENDKTEKFGFIFFHYLDDSILLSDPSANISSIQNIPFESE